MLFCIFCVMVSRAAGLAEASMMYVTLPIFLSVVVTADCFTVKQYSPFPIGFQNVSHSETYFCIVSILRLVLLNASHGETYFKTALYSVFKVRGQMSTCRTERRIYPLSLYQFLKLKSNRYSRKKAKLPEILSKAAKNAPHHETHFQSLNSGGGI